MLPTEHWRWFLARNPDRLCLLLTPQAGIFSSSVNSQRYLGTVNSDLSQKSLEALVHPADSQHLLHLLHSLRKTGGLPPAAPATLASSSVAAASSPSSHSPSSSSPSSSISSSVVAPTVRFCSSFGRYVSLKLVDQDVIAISPFELLAALAFVQDPEADAVQLRLQETAASANSFMVEVDQRLAVLFVAPSVQLVMACTPLETIGTDVRNLVDPKDIDRVVLAIQNGGKCSCNLRRRCCDSLCHFFFTFSH